ncbi:MAG: ABC transporter ATP-binding protein [bacterium]
MKSGTSEPPIEPLARFDPAMNACNDNQESPSLLQVRDLSIIIQKPSVTFLALHQISFEIQSSKTLAIVGESGSGKTMTALALLGLLPKAARQIRGEIRFGNVNLNNRDKKSFKVVRGRQIATVFQEPTAALNPVFKVGKQISDVVRTHLNLPARDAKARIMELFEQVNLQDPGWIYQAYPHQLSGGMAQRVMLAMALSCEPKLIIADEPTTALDVTTQAKILNLISDLQEKVGFSLLLISHDINVVARLADSILVMRAGRIIERQNTRDLLTQPREAYTKELIQSSPILLQEVVKVSRDETEIHSAGH